MPVVLVHGVPETEAIWELLIEALECDDVICLTPPGFGVPSPAGWVGTRTAYVNWLIGELEAIDGPIDLVGHDWGGGHVVGAVCERPDLVRSWASDILGIFHSDYVWHDMAQSWQTPEVGEQVVELMTAGTLDDRVATFEGLGLGNLDTEALAAGLNADMGACILTLYRSAVVENLGPIRDKLGALAGVAGLAIVASEDAYTGGEKLALDVAAQTGATVAHLPGLGHWWMAEDAGAGAAMLNEFWAGLPH